MFGDWVCLMYHDITPSRAPAAGAGAFFGVSASSFSRQLALIRSAGFEGCSIGAALADQRQKRIAISFDDGNIGQAAHAFPALVAHGMTATFFVATGWVGRRGFATWDQLREMRAAGMAIESHTHTHPFLSELSEGALRDELRRSRDLLCEHLGEQPAMIALPGGDLPRGQLRRVLAEEGYGVVATSRWGINRGGDPVDGIQFVRRCTVRGEAADREFLAAVNAGSWLRLRKLARETTLAFVRRSLGPTRYARWRRGVLDVAATQLRTG